MGVQGHPRLQRRSSSGPISDTQNPAREGEIDGKGGRDRSKSNGRSAMLRSGRGRQKGAKGPDQPCSSSPTAFNHMHQSRCFHGKLPANGTAEKATQQ